MKKYRVTFIMSAEVSASDESEAQDKAAMRLCQITPNDMEITVLNPVKDTDILIEVLGGVAEVTRCPEGITYSIQDHDNNQ